VRAPALGTDGAGGGRRSVKCKVADPRFVETAGARGIDLILSADGRTGEGRRKTRRGGEGKGRFPLSMVNHYRPASTRAGAGAGKKAKESESGEKSRMDKKP